MKSVTIKRHLRESFKSLKRNGWMSVAAVSAVTVTLLLVGVLLSILLNVNKVATDIENDVQVRVIIDRGTNKKQEAALKKKLEKIDGVKKIEFSSKKKELDNVVGVYGKEFRRLCRKRDNAEKNDHRCTKSQEAETRIRCEVWRSISQKAFQRCCKHSALGHYDQSFAVVCGSLPDFEYDQNYDFIA